MKTSFLFPSKVVSGALVLGGVYFRDGRVMDPSPFGTHWQSDNYEGAHFGWHDAAGIQEPTPRGTAPDF